MKYMRIHVGCTNIFHHDTWHVTCLSVVSRWCHPWREWENIHQPPPTVSCHSVCPRLRVTKNIQQSSDVNMEHATLHGWLLGSVKGWIIVNYRSAKLTNPLRNKACICERMVFQGFNDYQWIEKNRPNANWMRHAYACDSQWEGLGFGEWVSPLSLTQVKTRDATESKKCLQLHFYSAYFAGGQRIQIGW